MPKTRTWTRALGAAAIIVLVFGLAPTGFGQTQLTTVRFGTVGLESTYYAPILVAIAKGYYREEGIAIDQARLSDPDLVRAVASGALPIGIPEVGSGITATARGADIRVVAGFTDRYPYDLMVKREYQTIADLRGKRLSMWSTAPGVALTLMKRVLAGGGLREGDYSIIAGGNSSARYAALIAGQIDGTIITTPHNSLAKKEGFRSLAQLHSIPALFAGVIVNKTWAERNERILLSWLKATVRGFRYTVDARNKTEVVNLLAREFRADPAIVAADYDQLYQDETYIVSWDLVPSQRSMQTVLEILAEINLVPRGDPISKYYDLRYIVRAVNQVGR